jgi:asparagine synthase (glutamine-hydrolysing)
MAFSREVRLPFLDHRVVEFIFAAPADQKIRGASTKVILRNAIRGIVPEEIRIRKDKIGFATPECSWLRGPLQLWVEEILNSSAFHQREWIEPKVAQRVWERFKSGHDGWHKNIWRWLSLEVWARVFLDRGWERFRRVADAEKL